MKYIIGKEGILTKRETICIGSQAYQKQDFRKSLECIAHNSNVKNCLSAIVETQEYTLEEANQAFLAALALESKPKVLFKIGV